MQIMIARVGKGTRQLCRGPSNKIEFWFIRKHLVALRLSSRKINRRLFNRRLFGAETGVGAYDEFGKTRFRFGFAAHKSSEDGAKEA